MEAGERNFRQAPEHRGDMRAIELGTREKKKEASSYPKHEAPSSPTANALGVEAE